MKCAECRSLLQPFLDGELEVTANLRVLEHLNTCGSCAHLFETETAAWSRVRALLQAEGAPAPVRQSVDRWLRQEDRRVFWRNALGYAIPLSAAAGAILWIAGLGAEGADSSPRPDRNSSVAAAPHVHGPGIVFSVEHFRALDSGTATLNPNLLEKNGDFLQLDAVEARDAFLHLLGPGTQVPAGLRGKRPSGAITEVAFGGAPVSALLVSDNQDRVFGVYSLDRNAAGLEDLHELSPHALHEGVKLERCRDCHVLALTRGSRVYIFVSRNRGDVEALVDLVQQAF